MIECIGCLGGSVVKHLPSAQVMIPESWHQDPHQGHLGGTAVKRLPSAQGVIPALWDRAPHQAPCSAGSLLLPLPLLTAPPVVLVHALSLSDK